MAIHRPNPPMTDFRPFESPGGVSGIYGMLEGSVKPCGSAEPLFPSMPLEGPARSDSNEFGPGIYSTLQNQKTPLDLSGPKDD